MIHPANLTYLQRVCDGHKVADVDIDRDMRTAFEGCKFIALGDDGYWYHTEITRRDIVKRNGNWDRKTVDAPKHTGQIS